MNDRIFAVVSVVDDAGVALAQLVLRKDGTLDSYGDPSLAAEALALLLKSGPGKLETLIPRR